MNQSDMILIIQELNGQITLLKLGCKYFEFLQFLQLKSNWSNKKLWTQVLKIYNFRYWNPNPTKCYRHEIKQQK